MLNLETATWHYTIFIWKGGKGEVGGEESNLTLKNKKRVRIWTQKSSVRLRDSLMGGVGGLLLFSIIII